MYLKVQPFKSKSINPTKMFNENIIKIYKDIVINGFNLLIKEHNHDVNVNIS